jgi:D-alanine-D-alanine ligase
MPQKIRLAILFGGRSAEHEVSLQSAKSIIDALDKEKYDVVLIGIDKQGRWLLNENTQYLLHADDPTLIKLNNSSKDIAVLPGSDKQLIPAHAVKEQPSDRGREGVVVIGEGGQKNIAGQTDNNGLGHIDVVFPVLHGTNGEDGSMQGLLQIMDVAYVGANVLGSAVGMDKDVMKRLLREARIPVAKFITLRKSYLADATKWNFKAITQEIGLPFFVKPANLGSSVGVHKVHNEDEFVKAAKDALKYDTKILIEEYIDGREVEVAVLGNEEPIASVPGEIIPKHEFYSYEAKYIDEKGATLKIPADLPEEITKEIQSLAIKTFQTLCVEGMGRVDMFVTKDGKVYVNEINTIPGFTKISMYPKLWEASGLPYSDLIDRLIHLALARHEQNKKLKTTF